MHKFLILLLALSSSLAYAGKLDDFEKSATEPSSEKKSSNKRSGSTAVSRVGGDFTEAIAEAVVETVVRAAVAVVSVGTTGSLNKTHDRLGKAPFDPEWNEGELSDFAVPMLQADISYGFADGFDWKDGRFEAGLGPVSVFYRESEYAEPKFDSTFSIINSGFNYRMFFGNRLELDLGFGSYQLKGNQEYKSDALQLGVNLQLSDKVWLDYNRASVSGENLNLADSEYAVVFGEKHYFLRFLYRSMDTKNTSLDGIGMGLTLLY